MRMVWLALWSAVSAIGGYVVVAGTSNRQFVLFGRFILDGPIVQRILIVACIAIWIIGILFVRECFRDISTGIQSLPDEGGDHATISR